MEEVPNYGLSWVVYLVVACAFLGLSYWKSRHLKPWLRIPILTLIAAMAFTPAITVPGESWWSPAAIVMIFEIDQSGLAGFWRSGLSIMMVWLVATLFSFAGRWYWQKRLTRSTVSDSNRQAAE